MATETTSKGWAAAGKAAKDLAGQDRAVRDRADQAREQSQSGWVPLVDITPRPHGDTRKVAPGHVLDLAESIGALGLLEPLVVDRKLHLLAGAHRWEAAKLLAIIDPEQRVMYWAAMNQLPWPCPDLTSDQQLVFERVRILVSLAQPVLLPTRIMDVDAVADGDRALAIEIAENEKRRDYTKAEVESLAQRLRAAGYRAMPGKPKDGEKALGPALAVIIGKSERTVRRLLNDHADIRTDVLISDPFPGAVRRLRLAFSVMRDASKGLPQRKVKSLLKGMDDLEELLTELDGHEPRI